MNEKRANIPKTDLPNVKLCPNCGFPNKDTDSKCGYCEIPVNGPSSLPPGEWFKLFFRRLKWNLRVKGVRARNKVPRTLGRCLTALVGVALCVVGGFIFTTSVFTKSFSTCLIALFFLLYGISTLKGLVNR